jgi:hypothetical protein
MAILETLIAIRTALEAAKEIPPLVDAILEGLSRAIDLCPDEHKAEAEEKLAALKKEYLWVA